MTLASIVPYEAFPTADGDILLGGGNDRLYGVLCQRIGQPEWAEDERFLTNELRVKNRKILIPMIGNITKTKTTQVCCIIPITDDFSCPRLYARSSSLPPAPRIKHPHPQSPTLHIADFLLLTPFSRSG
jgi:hypothetical protein